MPMTESLNYHRLTERSPRPNTVPDSLEKLEMLMFLGRTDTEVQYPFFQRAGLGGDLSWRKKESLGYSQEGRKDF